MKALLDEQLSSEIAVELRRRKLNVEAVAERPELAGSSDQTVMDAATAEGRAVVTNNIKDFRPIAARRIASGQGHCGLILLPAKRSRTRAAAGPLADGIESVMRASPPGIPDTERWVSPIPGLVASGERRIQARRPPLPRQRATPFLDDSTRKR